MDNIWQIKEIMQDHAGIENAITVAKIAEILHRHDTDMTHFNLRRAIRNTIESLELPIASCDNGYYLITNYMEYAACINKLNDRIAGIEKRKKLIGKAWAKKFKQMSKEGGLLNGSRSGYNY